MNESESKYRVTVNCCIHGNCNHCAGITSYGKPTRLLHSPSVNKAHADKVVANWRVYSPLVTHNGTERDAETQGVGQKSSLRHEQKETLLNLKESKCLHTHLTA